MGRIARAGVDDYRSRENTTPGVGEDTYFRGSAAAKWRRRTQCDQKIDVSIALHVDVVDVVRTANGAKSSRRHTRCRLLGELARYPAAIVHQYSNPVVRTTPGIVCCCLQKVWQPVVVDVGVVRVVAGVILEEIPTRRNHGRECTCVARVQRLEGDGREGLVLVVEPEHRMAVVGDVVGIMVVEVWPAVAVEVNDAGILGAGRVHIGRAEHC